jgi:hypothetical protein
MKTYTKLANKLNRIESFLIDPDSLYFYKFRPKLLHRINSQTQTSQCINQSDLHERAALHLQHRESSGSDNICSDSPKLMKDSKEPSPLGCDVVSNPQQHVCENPKPGKKLNIEVFIQISNKF